VLLRRKRRFMHIFTQLQQRYRLKMVSVVCVDSILEKKSIIVEIVSEMEAEMKSTEIVENDSQPVLSKNQQKKLRRTQKWQAAKELKKTLKQKRKSEDISNASNDASVELTEEEMARKRERKMQEQQDYISLCRNNYGIVIDCAWEHEHTNSSLISLVQQIAFCYGVNRRSLTPSLIYVTGLGPRTLAQLSKNHHSSWKAVEFSEQDYMEVLAQPASLPTEEARSDLESPESRHCEKELVYLTSDATDTLETLDPNCVYIIGGIVDRNRLKGITYKKATEQGIRTAKLPIRENLKMKATHVLTINHVFDILKKFDELQSWSQAVEFVIPDRKKGELGHNRANSESEGSSDEGEGDGECEDCKNSENQSAEEGGDAEVVVVKQR
jgi:tRNA (guanine9-N1)-methyltransferase